ncbi:hypothetical protein, partial [Pradoshia eiseniae]|uniref:hypothetical protein n=1 Tax=Pradoshia eiseniae TaxID=2064768 RepID=UPI001F1ECE24
MKRVVERWPKDGESQAVPTLYPGKEGEGWEKGGRKAGEARELPPYAHARESSPYSCVKLKTMFIGCENKTSPLIY